MWCLASWVAWNFHQTANTRRWHRNKVHLSLDFYFFFVSMSWDSDIPRNMRVSIRKKIIFLLRSLAWKRQMFSDRRARARVTRRRSSFTWAHKKIHHDSRLDHRSNPSSTTSQIKHLSFLQLIISWRLALKNLKRLERFLFRQFLIIAQSVR